MGGLTHVWPERAPDSLWRATAGAAPTCQRTIPRHADVVIIGGGYTGLWTALHLLREQPSLHVVVLEQAELGFGASGRNGGWASALFPTAPERLAGRSSRTAALAMLQAMRTMVDQLGMWLQEERIDCDFAKGGTVTVARNRAQALALQAQVTHDQSWGGDDVLLDAQGIRDHIGAMDATGGSFTTHCAALHPLKLVYGLATAVLGRGGHIVDSTPALSYTHGVVSTARGVITCDAVVRATEGFTARFEQHHRELLPVYSLMIATEPLSDAQWDAIGLRQRETFTEQRHVVIYGQRTADGRIAFGGRGAPYHWGSAISSRFDVNVRVHDALHRTLLELFPMLRGVRISHRWGGALAIPRNYSPFVHFAEGIGTAGGYVGDGVAASALAGHTLADLILQRRTPRTMLPWVHQPGSAWGREPIRWLEANGMLAGLRFADFLESRTGRPSALARTLYRFL